MSESGNLKPFFEPGSIAVFGSFREGLGCYNTVKHLLHFKFSGRTYPINPSYKDVLGIKVYPDIKSVPESVDLAFILIPPHAVQEVVKECAEKGVKAFIIGSDGFAERDGQGVRLQQELVYFARQKGIRIIGPNTLGVVNTANGLITNPYVSGEIKRGGIAIITQSGLFGSHATDFSQRSISKICDLGNKSDIDETDVLEYLAEDKETKVIVMYLESVRDGKRFLDVSRRVAQNKPILVLKGGRTEEGARAVISHTGSLAGEDRTFDAAFKQAGVIQVEKFDQLLDFAKALLFQPLPRGNKIATITLTGGGGIMQTDTAAKYGLSLSKLSKHTIDELTQAYPWLPINPFDFGPIISSLRGELSLSSIYKEIIEMVLRDENVDALSVTMYAGELKGPEFDLNIFYELQKNSFKPITVCICGYDSPLKGEWTGILESFNIPVYLELEDAIEALGILFKYAEIRQKLKTE